MSILSINMLMIAKKILLLTIILTIFIISASGQGEHNIWYFGDHAGLDFNGGAPVAITNGAMSTGRGCASICNSYGDLLFYTDGITVWNANHQVMSNSLPTSLGGVLAGGIWATQAAVIAPMPLNPQFYYIFTVDTNFFWGAGSNGCRYSIVNMNLNGGLGNVVLASKNTLLHTPSSEKLCAVKHANGHDIWLISHPSNSGSFYSYLITSTGVLTIPVISTVGAFYSVYTLSFSNGGNNVGYLKASRDGSYVAAAISDYLSTICEVFQFNNATGQLTFFWSTIVLPVPYGVEFSPNSTVLYVCPMTNNNIYQYNLAAGSPTQINGSLTIIPTGTYFSGGALQLAPDGKIYQSNVTSPYLSVINNPNNLGLGISGCNYQDTGIYLAGMSSLHGLPACITSYYNIADFDFVYQCIGDTTELFLSDTLNVDSVYWEFGDPLSGNNTSTLWNTKHLFTDTGNYQVMLVTYAGGAPDTAIKEVEIYPYPEVSLGNDTSVCIGTSLTINAGTPGGNYFWFNGSTNQTVNITPVDTSVYWVEVIVNECLSSDSITVSPYNLTSTFSTTELYCFHDFDTLVYTGNANQNALFEWNFSGANVISGTGGGPYILNWADTGNYTISLAVTQGLCVSDTSAIELINPPGLELQISSGTIACYGESTGMVNLIVSGGNSLYSFAWDVGYTTQNLVGVPAGQYTVTVTYDSICTNTISHIVYQTSSPVGGIIGGHDILCFGQNNGFADLMPSGGTPPYSYTWSLNGLTTQDIENLYAGYYTVIVLDSLNCEFTTNVLIEEPDSLQVETTPDILICLGDSTMLSAFATGGTPPYSFLWRGTVPGQSITVSPLIETEYFVQATDSNNCISNTAYVTVSLFPPITSLATAQNDSICLGDSTYILANFSGGNGGPYACFVNGVEVEVPFIIKPEATTTYTIVGQDDCFSTSSSVEITIVVLDVPVNDFSSNLKEGCRPLEVSFIDNDPGAGYTYLWNFGEGDTSNYSLGRNPTHIYESPGTYDVVLTTISAYGCSFSTRISEMIKVFPNPDANFSADPALVSILEPTVYFENLSYPFVNSYLNFGDGSTEIGFNTTTRHTYSDTGLFHVSLIVENEYNCHDTITLPIRVYDVVGGFYAPTAFNPNSKVEANRVFKPQIHGLDLNHYHLLIYDRWGEKIFETFDYYHGWDGKVKNKSMATIGAYPWVVVYMDLNGKPHKETGTVLVIDK
jgi:PKD repeat protein